MTHIRPALLNRNHGSLARTATGAVRALTSLSILVGTGVFASAPAWAVDGCPASTTTCFQETTSTDPIRNVFCSQSGGYGWADYDLVLGHFRADVGSDAHSGAWAGVRAVDDYTVVGLPVGTPVQLLARLHVRGSFSLNCGYSTYGSIRARLTEGVSNGIEVLRSGTCANAANLDSLISVTVTTTVGTPFRLTSGLSSDVSTANASIQGQLSFASLPPGASIVSCQGYRQNAPVLALPVTWGAFKVLYR